MTRTTHSFILLLCAAAVALGAYLLRLSPFVVGFGEGVGLAAFVFLAVFSEALAISYVVGPNRKATSSVAFIPIFACALVFPPIAVLLVVALSITLTLPLRRMPNPWFGVFNVAQFSVAYSLAACVYVVLGGKPGRPLDVNYVGFVVMAVVFFTTNVLFITTFVAIRHATPWWSIAKSIVAPAGGNLLYDVLASPIAIFAAIIYDRFSAPALIMIALPLFLVRHSYAAKLQLERVNKDLLRVLIKAIETRDPYTSGHSIRVAALARAIGEDLGLGRRDLEELELAAILHDIGKVEALYAATIAKPFELSASERALIRTHAVKGAEILLGLSAFSEGVILAVRHHHERFDGTGYPDGLKGGAIPLRARVIMVCDSVDAMLSDRPYRSALTLPEVEAELRNCSGTQFDPAIVELVLTRGTIQRAAPDSVSRSEVLASVTAS